MSGIAGDTGSALDMLSELDLTYASLLKIARV